MPLTLLPLYVVPPVGMVAEQSTVPPSPPELPEDEPEELELAEEPEPLEEPEAAVEPVALGLPEEPDDGELPEEE